LQDNNEFRFLFNYISMIAQPKCSTHTNIRQMNFNNLTSTAKTAFVQPVCTTCIQYPATH